MQVHFLRASDGTPLSKRYRQNEDGSYEEVSTYPYITYVDSLDVNVTTIQEFHRAAEYAGSEGCCLLKGELRNPLEGESRAGKTSPRQLTQWLCLDVDCSITDMTPAEFLEALDPAFKDVTFAFQLSAGVGIKSTEGWRGHIYVLLMHPQSPLALKQWLLRSNLQLPLLHDRIGLSASGGALTYPLDITTCQNDKLIYIAPPICENFDDPVPDRWEVIEGLHPCADLKPNDDASDIRPLVDRKLHELRAKYGREPKSFRYEEREGTSILANPDPITVTGVKAERGFVYLNLDGGDSWGYFFPEHSPEILYNFKGEPNLYLRDVDENLYQEYANAEDTSADGSIRSPFGFLWPANDTYYRGFYNPETGELHGLYPTGSKQKLRDFFVQNGVHLPRGWHVDEWDLVFDPARTEHQVDPDQRKINTYRPTDYIKQAKVKDKASLPPVIARVLGSICASDAEVTDHFLNWLAYIFQTRRKSATAWIFQGCQGTGKGVFFSYVIKPLLGHEYCHLMTMDRMDDDFNQYLENNIVLCIDEADIGDSRNGNRLLARIKNLITEPVQHIRGMRRNAVTMPSYTNVMLYSNVDEIIRIEETDRRFNVAPRQEKALKLYREDIEAIEQELPAMADYLQSYEVSETRANSVLLNEARAQLIRLSENTIDRFFHAIKDNELGYFVQYLGGSGPDMNSVRYYDYRRVVSRWRDTVGESDVASITELRTVYEYLQNTTVSPSKFGRMCAKYNIHSKPVRLDNEVTRGIDTAWRLSDDDRSLNQNELASRDKVVDIKSKQ